MDIERQDQSGKKPLASTSKRPGAFWELIVPSERLEKGRLDPTIGAHVARSQANDPEGLKKTQPVVRKENATPHARKRANAANRYPHLRVMPRDKKPLERAEYRRPEPTGRAQPAHPHTSVAENFKRTQPVKSDKHADHGELSEGGVWAPTLHKGDKDEESSEGPNDTEGSDGDKEYIKDDDNENSETASDASSPATQISQPSHSTPRRASARVRGKRRKESKEPTSETAAPKRKKKSSRPASTKGGRPRKRAKDVVEDSDEDSDEDEAANRSAPHIVHRQTRARTRGQKLSDLQALPTLSRLHQPWTKKEDEILFNLRKQGESWAYIGERVLGRTVVGVKGHWDSLRTESLQLLEARAKGRRRRKNSSIVSMMAEIPQKNKRWSKEEEGILIGLRAQGKTLKYACKRIRGKTYGACKTHWAKIKDRYPQAVKGSKDLESDEKGDRSDRQDAQSSESQVDLGEDETESNSRSALIQGENRELSTNGDLALDADVDILSAKQPYQELMVIHESLVPVIASKSPKSNAASKDYDNQQASNPLTGAGDLSLSINGLAHPDQTDSQPALARKDPETKDEVKLGSFIARISAHGKQKLGAHRRSYSWSQ